MWRRTYLFLILVRLYFALSPSYLHPDENFQGPEVIAGRVYSYPVHQTWEFTTDHPIRSSFPLWLFYGLPMYILRWIWEGAGRGEVSPAVVYWTLRVLMFTLSFVLEDWAIHELVQSPRQRRRAVLLVASSYITWTLQTHTFSNSIETLVLAWSMVLIHRIVDDKDHSSVFASLTLGTLVIIGIFNRITFPAFLLIPGLQLLPHFRRKPFTLMFILLSALLTSFIAISLDTAFYNPTTTFHFRDLLSAPIITPLNNFRYNSATSNLSKHGLHPYYQHLVANLPQLLGPAFPLIFFAYRKTMRLASAASGVLILSLYPHQEARFLLPTIPLILSSIRLPTKFPRVWLSAWIIFNAAMGVLMGIYHQGGVVPTQIHLAKTEADVSHVFWWKTYSPPVWLLDGKNENLTTVDLMGIPGTEMLERVKEVAKCPSMLGKVASAVGRAPADVYLVAPRSAYFLKPYVASGSHSSVLDRRQEGENLSLEEVWSYRNHLNLDDLDFGDDGVWPTLSRVVGDRGLVVWKVQRSC